MPGTLTDQGLTLRRSLVIHRQPAASERESRLVSHDTGSSIAGLVCSAITPLVTVWVPELLAELGAHTERTIRAHAPSDDPWRANSTLLGDILRDDRTPSGHSSQRLVGIKSDDSQSTTPQNND